MDFTTARVQSKNLKAENLKTRNPENPKSWKPENGLAAHEVSEEDVYFDGQGHSVACPWQLLAARAGVPLSPTGTPRAAKGYPTALQEQGPHARIRNL